MSMQKPLAASGKYRLQESPLQILRTTLTEIQRDALLEFCSKNLGGAPGAIEPEGTWGGGGRGMTYLGFLGIRVYLIPLTASCQNEISKTRI